MNVFLALKMTVDSNRLPKAMITMCLEAYYLVVKIYHLTVY
jgi:hypothetical protein